MELQPHSLPSNKKRALQDWLSHQQADIFVSVLESKIMKLEAEACDDISGSSAGGLSRDTMIERAKSKALEIETIRQFIKVLKEVRDAEVIETYTATPTRMEKL